MTLFSPVTRKRALKFPRAWRGIFGSCFAEDQLRQLLSSVEREYRRTPTEPSRDCIFRALEMVRPQDVKVVIVGQDPYPKLGSADGLAFSTGKTGRVPSSLRMIYRELEQSMPSWSAPEHGDLGKWASQGVLLLNRILTVRRYCPMSHAHLGWEELTAAIIRYTQERAEGIVFLLWGAKAAEVKYLIDGASHFILEAPHPSPLAALRAYSSRRFLGCGHFIEANKLLRAQHKQAIDWTL